MNNLIIRQELNKRGIYHYKLAEAMGISEFTLCRKLRNELPKEKREEIIKIIKNIKGENNEQD